MALPHHFHNGAAAVAATVFRCSRRLRPLERHLRDLPKREPALPERWVTGLASYGIDRRSARRKCAGTTWALAPSGLSRLAAGGFSIGVGQSHAVMTSIRPPCRAEWGYPWGYTRGPHQKLLGCGKALFYGAY